MHVARCALPTVAGHGRALLNTRGRPCRAVGRGLRCRGRAEDGIIDRLIGHCRRRWRHGAGRGGRARLGGDGRGRTRLRPGGSHGRGGLAWGGRGLGLGLADPGPVNDLFPLAESGAGEFLDLAPAGGQKKQISILTRGQEPMILDLTGSELVPPGGDTTQVALVFRDVTEEESARRLRSSWAGPCWPASFPPHMER